METFFSGIRVLTPMLLIFSVIAFVFGWRWFTNIRKQALLENGNPAEAEIIEVWHTGLIVNRINIQVGMRLQVRPASLPPYETKTYTYISRRDPISYRPGMLLDVRYDPNNQKRIAIAGIKAEIVNGTMVQRAEEEKLYFGDQQFLKLDDLPEEHQVRYRQLMSMLADEDQDGIPDALDLNVTHESTSPNGSHPVEEGIEAVETLRNLKELLESDLITQAEYDAKKQEILSRM